MLTLRKLSKRNIPVTFKVIITSINHVTLGWFHYFFICFILVFLVSSPSFLNCRLLHLIL
nr:group II intron maturase-specific domain-containing protein [Staphylococcus pseudintermedius]